MLYWLIITFTHVNGDVEDDRPEVLGCFYTSKLAKMVAKQYHCGGWDVAVVPYTTNSYEKCDAYDGVEIVQRSRFVGRKYFDLEGRK